MICLLIVGRSAKAPYGKKEAAQELEELRGAPDPFLAPGAADIIMNGGKPAEDLRQKRVKWVKANKAPELKPQERQPSGGLGARLNTDTVYNVWRCARDAGLC